MVKSVLGVSHRGLTDWVIQRTSALILAIYSLGLLSYLLCHPDLSFAEWHTLFSQTGVKVATLLCLISLFFHAWVGMWTVFTDYLTCAVIRCIVNFLVLLMFFACFFWGLLILWSV